MSRQSEVRVAQLPALARSHMQGPMQAAGSRGERRGLNGGRAPSVRSWAVSEAKKATMETGGFLA